MSAEGWPTVRTFPRSLSQAFADERACAIEHHRAVPVLDWVLGVALAIAIGITLALVIVHHIGG
jgi:hypothetical protein